MIEFTNKTPTIADVYRYTYLNPHTYNRFEYAKRDIVKTRIHLERRITYRKNKEGRYSVPSERLLIKSYSYPQYRPYLSIKTKKAKKQRTIRHEYDVIMCIQPYGEENEYLYQYSKIIWRVGSFKKWQKPPQSKIKSVYKETREKLEKKYDKLPQKEKKRAIKEQIDKIKSRGEYLDVGDFCSRSLGICGDDYWRSFPNQVKHDALYGRAYNLDCSKGIKGINYCYFSKHAIALVNFLLRKGIIKYK